jgi:hypothetical protein
MTGPDEQENVTDNLLCNRNALKTDRPLSNWFIIRV